MSESVVCVFRCVPLKPHVLDVRSEVFFIYHWDIEVVERLSRPPLAPQSLDTPCIGVLVEVMAGTEVPVYQKHSLT